VKKSNLLPWMAVALLAHGAAYAASQRVHPHVAVPFVPLEIELTAVDTEPPPPPPPAPQEEVPHEPAPVVRPVNVAPRPIAPSAPTVASAAKVGALLTSGETSDSTDPVAFFSDPQGGAYGSGVVARGGHADHGAAAGVATAIAPPPPRDADEVTSLANLSRAPSLDEPDACRGFFPTEAGFDSAKVDLVVVVQAGGRVTSATIVRESPASEGFGAAARACLLSKRFTPGANRAGRAVTASAAVRVHFAR